MLLEGKKIENLWVILYVELALNWNNYSNYFVDLDEVSKLQQKLLKAKRKLPPSICGKWLIAYNVTSKTVKVFLGGYIPVIWDV